MLIFGLIVVGSIYNFGTRNDSFPKKLNYELLIILTCTLCIIKRGDRIDHIALLIIYAACIPHRARGGWNYIMWLVDDLICEFVIYLRYLQRWEEFLI